MNLNHFTESVKQTWQLISDAMDNVRASKKEKLSSDDYSRLMGLDFHRFSHLLPYRYYDSEYDIFINNHTLGLGLEIAPLISADLELTKGISNIITKKIDHTLTAQVILVGSKRVGHLLAQESAPSVAEDALLNKLQQDQLHFLQTAAKGFLPNKRGYKLGLRDYRAFLFLSKKERYNTIKAVELNQLALEIMSDLDSIGISNQRLDLVSFLSLITELTTLDNEDIDPIITPYDKLKNINEQVVDRRLELSVKPNRLICQIGEAKPVEVVSLSLMKLPKEMALWAQGESIRSMTNAALGINCPFIMSLSFKSENPDLSKTKALQKIRHFDKRANSSIRVLTPGVGKAAQDWTFVNQGLQSGETKLCNVFFNCTLLTTKSERVRDVSLASSAFAAIGMDVSLVRYQQLQSYLASLPFVLAEGMWQDLQVLGRLHRMTTWNATNFLPLVGDYKGIQAGQGTMLPSFRGQVSWFDPFSQAIDDSNIAVCATPGSGKSVFTQAMIMSVLSQGGKVWVIDVGGSYRNLCHSLGGTYLDVSTLQLNPFSLITDIDEGLELITQLYAVLISPNDGLSDFQLAHLRDAIKLAFAKRQQETQVDDVLAELEAEVESDPTERRIKDLIVQLKQYSVKHAPNALGTRIFNSPSALASDDPRKERFIVLEMDSLREQPLLKKCVLLALINNINQQMYIIGKDRKKMCILDEAWEIFTSGNKDAVEFINKGYRQSRKHHGSFVTIVQEIDIFFDQEAANAVWANSSNTIVMRQKPDRLAQFRKKHPNVIDDYCASIMGKFTPSKSSGYSEFLLQQGSAKTFHRLFLAPTFRILSSTKPEDKALLQELKSQGLTLEDAIETAARMLYPNEYSVSETAHAA